MQVGCYTLDLYCDRSTILYGEAGDGIHRYDEFPISYSMELGVDCRQQARKDGWILKRNGDAICPKCSGKGV